MADISPIPKAHGQQPVSLLYEEDPLPSLPNFDDIFRSFGPRSSYIQRPASVFSDDTSIDGYRPSNAGRNRRLSTSTVTSIGRPRHLVARSKAKGYNSRDAVTFVKDVGTRDLSTFLWTHNPPPQNWASMPDEASISRKKSWYQRRKTMKSDKPVLQLPDCAVATRTPNGQWHIAIHIPDAKDMETQKQPSSRIQEIKDSDTRSIISRRFSRATIANRMGLRQRGNSVSTIKTTNDDAAPPTRLTKRPPQHLQNPLPKPTASFSSRMFSTSEKPKAPSREKVAAAVLGPSLQDISAAAAAQSKLAEEEEDNYMDEQSQSGSHIRSDAYRHALVKDFVRQKRATLIRSTSMPMMQALEADATTEPFPDFLPSKSSEETLVQTSSPTPAAAKPSVPTTQPSRASMLGNAFDKAKNEARHALQQAQREESDAKAVVLKAEQDARDTIPALEASTNMARAILKEAKIAAAKAIEEADVDAAILGAKQAAKAQSAIMTAERQISTSKVQLEMLLSAANARLAEAQAAAQAASKELHLIALAEAKAEQERREAEEKEKARIAAEEKAAAEKQAKERAEALAAAEMKAIAEVRAAFAKAEQEAVAKAAADAEMQRLQSMALLKAAEAEAAQPEEAEVADMLPYVPNSSLAVTQDPEVRDMASRLRKMEQNNEAMLQTLTAVAKMGNNFEELAKAFADDEN